MRDEVKPKRRYDATRRRAQAEETRRAVEAAARRLFIERGYGGTTMDAIAQEAGTSVETVYAAFRSKRAILTRVMDIAVAGDEAPVALLDRAGPVAVREAGDQHEQIGLFAHGIREIMTRAGPIFEVIHSAAPLEPEIAALLSEYLEKRRVGMRFFVEAVASNGPLREGLPPEEAVDVVWTLTSAEVHRLLTGERGWSGKRYERWLAGTLERLLLP
jgi:TetR/AcrR family transcriptional regulator, regulator of autoinduction and epiphytic fitness